MGEEKKSIMTNSRRGKVANQFTKNKQQPPRFYTYIPHSLYHTINRDLHHLCFDSFIRYHTLLAGSIKRSSSCHLTTTTTLTPWAALHDPLYLRSFRGVSYRRSTWYKEEEDDDFQIYEHLACMPVEFTFIIFYNVPWRPSVEVVPVLGIMYWPGACWDTSVSHANGLESHSSIRISFIDIPVWHPKWRGPPYMPPWPELWLRWVGNHFKPHKHAHKKGTSERKLCFRFFFFPVY